MNRYDYTYVIKDGDSAGDTCETAINRGIDGGLVLVIIQGKDIAIRNRHFGANVTVHIESVSDKILFESCSFEGRELLIKNQGSRVLYKDCSFQGGSAFIKNEGYQVFTDCRFLCLEQESVLFEGGSGANVPESLVYSVIMDSRIEFEREQSVLFVADDDTKASLIRTEIEEKEKREVWWTKSVVNENTFSYYHCEHICGADECGCQISEEGILAYNPWNLLSGDDGWDPLHIEDKFGNDKKVPFFVACTTHVSLVAGSETKTIQLVRYPRDAAFGCELRKDAFVSAEETGREENKIFFEIKGVNDGEEVQYGFLTFMSQNGLKTDCVAEVKPSLTEPPKFLSTPVILMKDGKAVISYELELDGREDESEISWYRVDHVDRTELATSRKFIRSNEKNCRKIAVSRYGPCKEIPLTIFDIGRHLKVNIKPKHNRSRQGPGLNIMSRIVMVSDVRAQNIVLNLQNQVLDPYYESEPGYGTSMGHWRYGRISDCRYSGMIAESEESRFYFDGDGKSDAMVVYVILDMENNGGCAIAERGGYQELYIKYDSNKKCGYGLRYECVRENVTGFRLFKYAENHVQPISNMVTGSYMKSGMDIRLSVMNGVFSAKISVPDMDKDIILESNAEGNEYSGMGIKNHMTPAEGSRISIRHIEISYPEIF